MEENLQHIILISEDFSKYSLLIKHIIMTAHINVYNLFDIRNELTVYGDTGRSSYSLIPTYTPQYSGPGLNSLDEYLIEPTYYSAPRQIRLGFSLSFK